MAYALNRKLGFAYDGASSDENGRDANGVDCDVDIVVVVLTIAM